MQYFKHPELADKYHVSLKTVHNWINAAKEEKSKLKLHRLGSYTYIANTPENTPILQGLAENARKRRNTAYHKDVQPKPEFYTIFSRRQILDIITNLTDHCEIPRQYNYLQDGAANWNEWLKRLESEGAGSTLMSTVELLRNNLSAIDQLIKHKKKVNVIDLGVGNARPVRELLGHLIDLQVLHRYIAIDISPAMLDIARHNVEQWYGDTVKFEGYVRDITNEQFDDLLVEDMLDVEASQTINLVLLLGSTPVNFRP